MLSASIQKYLNQLIFQKPGLQISSLQFHTIGGRCINDTYQVTINHNTRFFLKLNSVTSYPALFEKEKTGLEFLWKQKIIRVPSVIAYEIIDDDQILLLEWIENGIQTVGFWKQFGEKLAMLHKQTWLNGNQQTVFGFTENNYIGALPQLNNQQDDW